MNDFLLRAYNIKWGHVDYKERKARIEQVVKELKDLHSTLSSSVHSAWDKGLLIIEDKHSPTQVAMLQALLHLEGLEYRTRPRTDAGTAPALAPALAPAATPATAPAPAPHVVQLPQHGQRYTDDQTGRFYYYNRWSSSMQWESPSILRARLSRSRSSASGPSSTGSALSSLSVDIVPGTAVLSSEFSDSL